MGRLVRLIPLALLMLVLPLPASAASDPVLEAARKTAEARSVTYEISIVSQAAGQRTVMEGTGAQRGGSARLTLRMRLAGTTMRLEAILVRERGRPVLYLRSPLMGTRAPAGKTWMRIDLGALGAGTGLDLTGVLGSSQSWAPLQQGVLSSTRLGSEVVAGKPAVRYRAVVDVRRAARAIPEYRQQLEALERASGVRLGRLSYDVWVGGDGRLRRIRFATPAVAGARSVITLTFLAYDVPVRISAPPRSQVFTP